MALSLADFRTALLASGVLSKEELQAFEDSLTEPENAESLAKSLVQHRLLTKYQAAHIYQSNEMPLVLGSYVIEDKIGSGGMGRVYRGKHIRLDRPVAIKLLPPDAIQSPKAIKRFHREARAAARLTHPNIVRTYDVDEQDGFHYLVMEYVPGKDLASIVKQSGPIEVSLAAWCVQEAAAGLAYAHEQGIIHRDIKPANLLMARQSPSDEQPVIKVLDMGLARIATTGGVDDDSTLTKTGQVMGSVDYMSPEQASDTRRADARSDVYSLGCTLYVLLTGKVPYYEKSLLKRVLAHREKPTPDVRSRRPEVPDFLAELCQRMMAKNPDDRPQTMHEVIRQIEAGNKGAKPIVAAAAPVRPPVVDQPKSQLANAELSVDAPLPEMASTTKRGNFTLIAAIVGGVLLIVGVIVVALALFVLSYLT